MTTDDKYAYTRRFMLATNVGGKEPNGGMTATPPEFRNAAAIKEIVETNIFAAAKGPFTDAPPIIAGDGSIWVQRSQANGAAPRYDVFEDSDGLQRLELYPIQ